MDSFGLVHGMDKSCTVCKLYYSAYIVDHTEALQEASSATLPCVCTKGMASRLQPYKVMFFSLVLIIILVEDLGISTCKKTLVSR